MEKTAPPAAEDPQDEIVALVRVLHETQQRLQELTGGEVDAVTIPGGESYLLLAAQEKLRRNEQTLHLRECALGEISQGVIFSDAQRLIVYANIGFEKISGYSEAELLGKNCSILQGPLTDPATVVRMRAHLDAGQPFDGEILNYRKDGTPFWNDLSIAPIIAEQGGPARFIGIQRDITPRKRTEETLRENLKNEQTLRLQAAAGEQVKREFLAVMSHEMRTPMSGILGFTEMITHDAGLSAESRGYVETIRISGEALMHMLDDVLDFSRIEAGRLKIQKAAFSPSELIRDIVALFAPQVREKGLEFQHAVAGDVPRQVLGDPGRTRQVLVNLVGNAVKFTERGVIKVGVRPYEGRLEFFVHDSGSGIAADKLEAIFEAFTQGDSSTSRSHGGTGLGLTISRRLAGLMGGELRVQSKLDEGSEFSLRIPLDPAEAVAPKKPLSASPAIPLSLRVLVVEDDKVNLKLFVIMLRKLGYEPLTAGSGAEAVRIYEEARPDCILMDMQMPGMDGIEATRKIRELEQASRAPRTFIAALTANILPEDRGRCYEAGMDFFLNKPVKSPEIVNVLAKAAQFRIPLEAK